MSEQLSRPVIHSVPYVQGFPAPGQGFLSPEPEDSRSSLLVEYLRTILLHRWLILSLAGAGVLASVLIHLNTQPVYRTRTSLDIQSLNSDFMNMKSIDPTEGTPSDTAIQTQIKLLQSDSLMDRVKTRIASEPHPDSISRTDQLSRMKQSLHLGQPAPIRYDKLLDNTANGVKVKPLGITQLVEITCDSWDPAFAAQFCNTMTSEFQEEDLDSRGEQAKRTSDWLMHQAADIRQKAEEAQQRLIAATGNDGLVLAQPTDTVGEDALRDLQGEIVKAQADRMEREAQLAIARSASADSLPNGAQGPTYAADKAKLTDLEDEVAALVPPLTEANPRIIHLRSQIKQVQASMAQENASSIQRLQNEFNAAKHREELLRSAYHVQEGAVSSDLQKASQIDLLRREVQSEQQLYQTLLQRAKEAGFASAMQATTIRVVDLAQKPKIAVYPQRITAAAVGLIIGSLLGILISFFKERHSTALRLPGESERLLNLEELGVIPSPKALRGVAAARSRTLEGAPVLKLPKPGSRAAQTAAWNDDFSLVAEAYRSTTHSILRAERQNQARVYVVSSPNAGEGKTTVIANLGIALSKSKLRVVLIDGDLRKPTLHSVLGVPNDSGFRDVLRGDFEFDGQWIKTVCKATTFHGLSLIPSGSGHEPASDLLHSPHFKELLRLLSEEFDVILVDTPPMLHIADARIFAGQAHGAILIFRAGVTTRDQAINARVLLDRDQVRVVGSILNDFNPKREGKQRFYSSYYAYKQSSTRDKAVRA